ncbi:MAG: hypothetical protein U0744_21180 [Gemmataceae bacterium]
MRYLVRRLVACAIALLMADAAYAEDAYLISKHQGRVGIDAIPRNEPTPRTGLVLWADEGREKWRVAPAGWSIPSAEEAKETIVADAKASRGVSLSSLGSLELGQLTKQIDQLRIAGGTRDLESSFLTPSRGGILLSGTITIRRMPRGKESRIPRMWPNSRCFRARGAGSCRSPKALARSHGKRTAHGQGISPRFA